MLSKLSDSEYNAMRKAIRGIALVAAATGEEPEAVLDKVMPDRLPPGSERVMEMPRRMAAGE